VRGDVVPVRLTDNQIDYSNISLEAGIIFNTAVSARPLPKESLQPGAG